MFFFLFPDNFKVYIRIYADARFGFIKPLYHAPRNYFAHVYDRSSSAVETCITYVSRRQVKTGNCIHCFWEIKCWETLVGHAGILEHTQHKLQSVGLQVYMEIGGRGRTESWGFSTSRLFAVGLVQCSTAKRINNVYTQKFSLLSTMSVIKVYEVIAYGSSRVNINKYFL